MEFRVKDAIIETLQGDITKVRVDAIVNAANSELMGGGGVDGAVHKAGGPSLMAELNKIRPENGCPTGSAVVTAAGNLPAKHVLHAVGPVWHGGGKREPDLLASAYSTSMELAAGKKAKTISFPAISTGVYGYPVEKAAPIALKTVADFLAAGGSGIERAVFVLFSAGDLSVYESALKSLTGKY